MAADCLHAFLQNGSLEVILGLHIPNLLKVSNNTITLSRKLCVMRNSYLLMDILMGTC